MFDYNKMIKRAIEFFPRWTDIRKRYKTSNGGNLIGAILDESLKIEEAIQEYITGKTLETLGGGCIFQGREVSQREAYEYLDKTKNYAEMVGKMLVKEDSKSLKKSLVQRVVSVLKTKKDN